MLIHSQLSSERPRMIAAQNSTLCESRTSLINPIQTLHAMTINLHTIFYLIRRRQAAIGDTPFSLG